MTNEEPVTECPADTTRPGRGVPARRGPSDAWRRSRTSLSPREVVLRWLAEAQQYPSVIARGSPSSFPRGSWQRRLTSLNPRGEDRLGLVEAQDPRRALRSGASIEQTWLALGTVAAEPLVGGRPADSLHRRGVGDRPAERLDPDDQELAAKDRQLRASMTHESLLSVRSGNTPYRSGRLSFVNNLVGNHT